MSAAVGNLKWVLSSLLETDRHFVHYTKKAQLSNISATRDGNLFKVCFDFKDKTEYSVALKITQNDVESLFYENYSISSEFPMPRYLGHLKNVLLAQHVDTFGVKQEPYIGLKEHQVYNLTAHLADLHGFHLTSPVSETGFLPAKKPITVEEFQTAASKLPNLLSSKDVLLISVYIKFASASKTDLEDVCVHGDFTSANVFWAKDEFGNMSNKTAAVVGWSRVHSGSPTDDLAQLLISCVDPDERLFIQKNAVELYYNSLRSHLKQSDDLMDMFNLSQVLKSFNKSFIDQTLTFVKKLSNFDSNAFKTKGVAEAIKAKLEMRARFALMETMELIKKIEM
ncbi:hypothetical protein L596_023196 [Steinernema carpocapsae]|uniref:CHK kinase-like domain-containing protein n=1 Tax=Steinernema carpocapsae TaxID=34508 RepID=A0A4U5MCX7_STECR|nr:hypothetical protein L596_023196 [Steinernema carpocapsae]